MSDGNYWIPAFAGMTTLMLARRPAMTAETIYTRIGIST